MITDQQALDAIQRICGDDFCEDLDLRTIDGPLLGDLGIAHEKLSAVYRIAHSLVKSNICHGVHGGWRDDAEKTYWAGCAGVASCDDDAG